MDGEALLAGVDLRTLDSRRFMSVVSALVMRAATEPHEAKEYRKEMVKQMNILVAPAEPSLDDWGYDSDLSNLSVPPVSRRSRA